MTAANSSYDPNLTQQNNSNNPALNQQAFERTIARTGAKEKTGMTAMGTYLKTGLLLLLLILAGAWGWSQVRIETVFGQQVAIQPGWTLRLLQLFWPDPEPRLEFQKPVSYTHLSLPVTLMMPVV